MAESRKSGRIVTQVGERGFSREGRERNRIIVITKEEERMTGTEKDRRTGIIGSRRMKGQAGEEGRTGVWRSLRRGWVAPGRESGRKRIWEPPPRGARIYCATASSPSAPLCPSWPMVIKVRVEPHNASRKTLSELEGAAKFCAPLTAAWIFLSHRRINLLFNASDTHRFPYLLTILCRLLILLLLVIFPLLILPFFLPFFPRQMTPSRHVSMTQFQFPLPPNYLPTVSRRDFSWPCIVRHDSESADTVPALFLISGDIKMTSCAVYRPPSSQSPRLDLEEQHVSSADICRVLFTTVFACMQFFFFSFLLYVCASGFRLPGTTHLVPELL